MAVRPENGDIPPKFRRVLTPEALERIEAAVATAEKVTAAEFVPVVVDAVTDIALLTRLLTAYLSLAVVVGFLAWEDVWDFAPLEEEPTSVMILLGFVVSFILLTGLAFVLARRAKVIEWLVGRRELDRQLLEKAQSEFYCGRLAATKNRAGILFLVSLKERRAAILADENAHTHLGGEGEQAILEVMLEQLKNRDLSAAFCEAIQLASQRLKTKLPPPMQAQNELSNHLVLRD